MKAYFDRIRSNKFVIFILFASISILIHTYLYKSSIGKQIEHILIDNLFNFRGPLTPNPNVAIISMDETSYQNLGIPLNQAWPREFHAKLLQKLAAAGTKKVVFDVLFLGAGSNDRIDKELSKSFALLPTIIGADQGERETKYGLTTEILFPYSLFSGKVSEVALVGLPEEYNMVRRFRLPDPSDELTKDLRPLSVAAANISNESLPGNDDLINFYGPAGTIPNFSYYQILEEDVPFPKEELKDKIVFIGLQLRSDVGPEQKDSFLTSFSDRGRTYGVEIHATATANLISHSWIKRFPIWKELIILNSLLVIVSIICITMQPLHAAYSLFSLLAIWILVTFFSFKALFFLPGLTLFGVCTPLMYFGSTLTSYLVTRRSQRQLEKAFGYYLSPHMAKSVSKDPLALSLGGEKVYATALFSDIAGFTTISESMSAEDVTHMLNQYFSELVESVFESEGTLIKFIGDSVFAIWGAPIKRADHAQAAFEAALSMQIRLQRSQKLKAYPVLPTRIGIHSGQMVVGNLGSERRFDFTAIGDAVNIASRVEGLNKHFGTSIIITDSVVADLDSKSDLFFLGKVKVFGKSESVSLFTKLEEQLFSESYEQWKEAISIFENRSWENAIGAFHKIKSKFPYLNKAASFYIENITEYSKYPPKSGWQGDLIAKSK